MKIDRIHFYVEDAKAWRDWFVSKLGFQAIASYSSDRYTDTEVVKSGFVCFALSSPRSHFSPVWQFLRHHPPGVADVAFVVEDLETVLQEAIAHGAKVLQPPQLQQGCKWGKISAWGSLAHTLVERRQQGIGEQGDKETSGQFNSQFTISHSQLNFSPAPPAPELLFPDERRATSDSQFPIIGIDHIVLNVAAGDLEPAVAWYEKILGFRSQQAFTIQTNRSALHSQVMVSSNSCVQFPINQPASPNSQIQEFLDCNRGAGIQHIALKTSNIIEAIAQFRDRGVAFLPVPPAYYTQLQQRWGIPISVDELQAIAGQQILVDWQEPHPHALLLQTFTQPIFSQPTFFFEIIERRSQAMGFGEGNFRALFEAIEREQLKRGSLQDRESGKES